MSWQHHPDRYGWLPVLVCLIGFPLVMVMLVAAGCVAAWVVTWVRG